MKTRIRRFADWGWDTYKFTRFFNPFLFPSIRVVPLYYSGKKVFKWKRNLKIERRHWIARLFTFEDSSARIELEHKLYFGVPLLYERRFGYDSSAASGRSMTYYRSYTNTPIDFFLSKTGPNYWIDDWMFYTFEDIFWEYEKFYQRAMDNIIDVSDGQLFWGPLEIFYLRELDFTLFSFGSWRVYHFKFIKKLYHVLFYLGAWHLNGIEGFRQLYLDYVIDFVNEENEYYLVSDLYKNIFDMQIFTFISFLFYYILYVIRSFIPLVLSARESKTRRLFSKYRIPWINILKQNST